MENRLTQSVVGGVTSSYVYNGDGNRMNRTRAGTTTNYVQDLSLKLPMVQGETGAATSYYFYGLGRVARASGAGWEFYHTDGLGTVRVVTDSSGNVTSVYTYGSAFGTGQTPAAGQNAYRYAGEETDGETGYLYLRARYYDPAVGRFITKDPFPALASDTQTINRYVYVGNNPVGRTDPSGKCFCLAMAFAGPVGWLLLAGLITYAAAVDLQAHPDRVQAVIDSVGDYLSRRDSDSARMQKKLEELARRHGADNTYDYSDELHRIKEHHGRRPNDNVEVNARTGDVTDPKTGKKLGNVVSGNIYDPDEPVGTQEPGES